MASLSDQSDDDPAHAEVLGSPDAYARYYTAQDSAFKYMETCLKVRDARDGKETYESTMLADMLQRLRYSTAALRLKYAYPDPNDPTGSLRVDAAGSGFPIHHHLTALEVDLVDKDNVLDGLPSAETLDDAIVKSLLQEHEKPATLLNVRAKRAYLETLDAKKLFLPFTMGPVSRWTGKELDNYRRYIGGWGCYDRVRNIPFVHYMVFDQNSDEQPLEDGGDTVAKLVKGLRIEGSLAPDLLKDLGDGIDHAIDTIHPKLIKRVRIGPFYTPAVIRERPEKERSPVESTLLDVLVRSGCEDEFALMFNEEILISTGQTEERGSFMRRIVRQAFYVPQLDDSAGEVGATRCYRYLIMPHRALQAMRQDEKDAIPRFAERHKYGYTEQEEIYEVG